MPPPYYRARYYHTDLQRFISEDPIGFRGGDVNVYAYVRNRPVSTTDPLGLWAAWFHRQTTRDAATNCGMSDADADALADATRAQDFMFFGLLPSLSTLSPWSAKHGMPGGRPNRHHEHCLTRSGRATCWRGVPRPSMSTSLCRRVRAKNRIRRSACASAAWAPRGRCGGRLAVKWPERRARR